MIELIGVEGSSEYRAATMIVDALESAWHGISTSPPEDANIKIAVSAKLAGYRVQDLDIIMCGMLGKPRLIKPTRMIRDQHGNKLQSKPIRVENFAVAIEVKDHGEDSVRVAGDQVQVKYSTGRNKGWKSATDQNVNQVHSLGHYFDDQHIDVFVRRVLLMPSLSSISAPSAVASGFNVHQLFSAIAAPSPVLSIKGQGILSSGKDGAMERVLQAPIFQMLAPTKLDRKRMDRLCTKSGTVEDVAKSLGSLPVFLRGHGGTGKTVVLLQSAWRQYRNEGARSLFLTYNHALAADIRRSMALMGVPAGPDEGGIKVETVMRFMYRWFRRLHMLDDEELDFENYDSLCSEAIEMVNSGAVTTDDIEKIKQEEPELFDFDLVFVDEGQDWPESESSLLKLLYAAKQLCIADGIDQLIRGKRARWDAGINKEQKKIITLNKCLRMKRNLSLFAKSVARQASLGWEVEPNDKAGGGRVIITDKPYSESQGLHEELLENLRSTGNAELDMLFCVPPKEVDVEKGTRTSRISRVLNGWGYGAWDGVDPISRQDFPRSTELYRIVQYESCRGLEGWIVVLDAFDEFLEGKRAEKIKQGLSAEEEGLYDLEEVAQREAWRWATIALTRPIDTVVIQLKDPGNQFSKILLGMAKEHEDFVELT